MFLQHALSCHVCHRSLFFIPTSAMSAVTGPGTIEGGFER